MVFPWKKVKSSRLSRLVVDLHQPPNRGGSLVVETGFPTSLIDLIVKNRDRLRKSPESKSTSQIPTTTPPNENIQSSQVDDVGELVLVQRECVGRFAFGAAFKVIIVAALAVSARELALWIMIAAFLLLLIEFVGSTFLSPLRPESRSIFLDSWIGKGLLKLIAKQESTVVPDSRELIDSELESEIQIVESEMETIRRTKNEQHSRRGRIRRHLIKKLVPKKLRHRRKKGDNEDQRGAYHMHKMEEIEDESEEEDDDRIRTGDEVVGSGHCLSVIVIVVAGVVVGGRGVGLLVTLVWCFMLTYIGRFR